MTKLTEYISTEALCNIQESFCKATEATVNIYNSDKTELLCPPCRCCEGCAGGADASGLQSDSPVIVDDEILARVILAGCPNVAAGRQKKFTNLMAEMLSRLAGQQKQLRLRAQELASLYRVTAEFAGQRDLQNVLDMVTQSVVEVMRAKGSTIRLLSEDRQELLIKSKSNLSSEYLNKGPIMVSDSLIDSEVLATLKPVYIKDSQNDSRILYPQEAKQEGIVSALCCPMVYKGEPVGVLRIYMGTEYEFDWFEMRLAEAISAEAAAAIVHARLYQEAVRSANMQRQLRMAATVQRRMIPASAPKMKGLQFGAIYVPCFELGGDFYDFIKFDSTSLGISICDVVGKGVRASLLMASIRTSLRAHAANVYDLRQVISNVNKDLCADTEVNDFATLFYGVINSDTRVFTYVNAGHIPTMLVRKDNVIPLKTGGGVVGIDPQMKWQSDSVQLEAGDVLVMFSDGVTDAMNFDDVTFGKQRIEKAILSAIELGRDADGIVKHILWEMRRFVGLQTQIDDLTIVSMKVE